MLKANATTSENLVSHHFEKILPPHENAFEVEKQAIAGMAKAWTIRNMFEVFFSKLLNGRISFHFQICICHMSF